MKKKKSPQSLGGKAVIEKVPPDSCPRCDRSMKDRSWHGYLGHLGIHGLADRYFEGISTPHKSASVRMDALAPIHSRAAARGSVINPFPSAWMWVVN